MIMGLEASADDDHVMETAVAAICRTLMRTITDMCASDGSG
jgi:hypothetical protein